MNWKQYMCVTALVGLIGGISPVAEADTIRLGDAARELPAGVTVFDIHNVATPQGRKDLLTEEKWTHIKSAIGEEIKKIRFEKLQVLANGIDKPEDVKVALDKIEYAIKELDRPNVYQLKGSDAQGHHVALAYTLSHVEKLDKDFKYDYNEGFSKQIKSIGEHQLMNKNVLKKEVQRMESQIFDALNERVSLHHKKLFSLAVLDTSGVIPWENGQQKGFYVDMRASIKNGVLLQGMSSFLIEEYGPHELNYVIVVAPDSSYEYWKKVLQHTWHI